MKNMFCHGEVLLDRKFWEAVLELLKKYSNTPHHKDGKILGSMTTTPHPLAVYAYLMFIHTNASDPVIFKEIENMMNDIIYELIKLYHGGESGILTSGGTESNIAAILVAKKIFPNRSNTVIAPDTVHVSVDKACDIMNCKLVKIPTNGNPVNASILEEYVRKYNPFAVVITAGTTERGLIDPVKDISELAEEYNVYLHVDAAYGGLLIPFLYRHGIIGENLKFYNGVSSISVDFHKNGLAPIPSGILLFNSKRYSEKICYKAEYTLYGKYCGLLGTRPGGSVASIWVLLKMYGLDLYEKIALKTYNIAMYTYRRLSALKELKVFKPILPIVVFKHKYIDYIELLQRILSKGYFLYKSPSLEALRIVIMPHVEKSHIDGFVNIVREIIQ